MTRKQESKGKSKSILSQKLKDLSFYPFQQSKIKVGKNGKVLDSPKGIFRIISNHSSQPQ